VILASALFYVLIPRIEVRRDVSSADLIMEKIVLTTTAEMAVYWDIHLDTNSRVPIAVTTKSKLDKLMLQKYVDSVKDVKLTASMGSEELHHLLSGSISCHSLPTVASLISTIAKDFFNLNPGIFICIIPVLNTSNSLVGQINIGWRTKPSDEILNSTLVQTKGLLQVR
jgi:hypothetical protein